MLDFHGSIATLLANIKPVHVRFYWLVLLPLSQTGLPGPQTYHGRIRGFIRLRDHFGSPRGIAVRYVPYS